ncbi:AEC family transporter [Peteryoungia desertarenae]|uniref:AEC family transporter n=1 Tax=Peteryoungia desertarenae TaxID=1813451 RepID=A0ABX6QLB0_9HYPH|nr:AEC family transporter [Peteryoungia desertarenae]QLF69015.1 AEC family transporter [Peteryoungia desertarenae]
MSEISQDVLPLFILILLGFALVRAGIVDQKIGDALGDFVFKVAVPMLLFRTIVAADFQGASPFRLWIAYFTGVGLTWFLGHLLATRLFGLDLRMGVLAGLSAAFANNVFIGLPLVDHTIGQDGMLAMSILLAIHLPLMMIVGTLAMEQAERAVRGPDHKPGGIRTILRQVGMNLVRNPLIIGLTAGLAVQVMDFELPQVIDSVVGQIAGVAAPTALISLGMTLNSYRMIDQLGISSTVAILKLFFMPAIVWGGCHLLSLSPTWTAALVLTSCVPTGINAWLIANRFGVGQGLAASVITQSTAAGVVSVTFWAWLLL